MKAILLDIEGTTTPIDFVHKTLFPFAKERLTGFVESHLSQLNHEINEVAAEHSNESDYREPLEPNNPASVAAYLCYLIDQDRKSTPLKSIQGKIWKAGYESGELESIVFEDVPPALARWHAAEKTIAIYSSGSVLAQQLLFRYTNRGDLTRFISNYFDTKTGAKRHTASYREIAATMRLSASEVLFLSDIPEELDAAKSAGMSTALSIRPGNAIVYEESTHMRIQTFDGLE